MNQAIFARVYLCLLDLLYVYTDCLAFAFFVVQYS
jgi:hypothetical protein